MARAGTFAAISVGGVRSGSGPGQPQVSESQLLDVLYEILAQGRDPHARLTLEQVEAFLHEHARAPKSRAEMLAFFESFELSTDPAAYGGDPELGEVASGLHRERGPTSSLVASELAVIADCVTGSHAVSGQGPQAAAPTAASAQVISKLAAPAWLRASLLVLALGLALVTTLSYTHARDLENKLGQAHLQQRGTDAALTALEQRALHLQGALGASENGRRELAASLRVYMADQAAQRAADQLALQKVLGPRYQVSTAEGPAPAP